MATAVSSADARAALYQLFGGLLLECASEEALRDVHEKKLLPTLAASAPNSPLSSALLTMHTELARDLGIQQLRADHARLFLGASKSKAPPWESVYRSEERLVWQAPAYAVLNHYAKAGFGYDDMTAVPPDHVGRELLFVATLAVEAQNADEASRCEELTAAQQVFLVEHVLAWVPQFLEDVRKHATTEFYRALADGLTAHLKNEGKSLAPGASAPGPREATSRPS